MIALLDADVICYRAAAVAVNEVSWDGEEISPLHNLKMAKEVAVDLVNMWTKAADAKRNMLVFSDRTKPEQSFRYAVHPDYKGNRPDEKPPLHDAVAAFLRDAYQSIWIEGLEGDDTIGLLATNDNKYTAVSIDKDMLTLPIRQANPDRADDGPRKLKLREADYSWMYQTITGDAVDNFKGAPGAGPKAAQRALAMKKNLTDMWSAVLQVYADQHDNPKWGERFVTGSAFDEALMNARCARILRHGDYKDGKVRLWHPDPDEVEWIKVTE